MIDAHAHLVALGDGVGAALQAARAAGVTHVVQGGTAPADDEAARRLAAEHPSVSWTTGLHPWWVPDDPAARGDRLAAVARALAAPAGPPPVAIGEVGLDALRGPPLDGQRLALRALLDLARQRDLPVVLHVVRAHGDLLAVLEGDGAPPAGGVVHGFTGAAELALRYVRLGLHVGLGPRLLREDARRAHASARALPASRVLVETDSPDQARGPADVARVVDRLAALRGERPADVARYTADNAIRLFRLGAGARRLP